jgi:hypothetical protein
MDYEQEMSAELWTDWDPDDPSATYVFVEVDTGEVINTDFIMSVNRDTDECKTEYIKRYFDKSMVSCFR